MRSVGYTTFTMMEPYVYFDGSVNTVYFDPSSFENGYTIGQNQAKK